MSLSLKENTEETFPSFCWGCLDLCWKQTSAWLDTYWNEQESEETWCLKTTLILNTMWLDPHANDPGVVITTACPLPRKSRHIGSYLFPSFRSWTTSLKFSHKNHSWLYLLHQFLYFQRPTASIRGKGALKIK